MSGEELSSIDHAKAKSTPVKDGAKPRNLQQVQEYRQKLLKDLVVKRNSGLQPQPSVEHVGVQAGEDLNQSYTEKPIASPSKLKNKGIRENS